MDPGNTPKGKLPPFEVAKAVAFEKILIQMEKHMKKCCYSLLGESRAEFTAKHLKLVGGKSPSSRAVKLQWAKAKTATKKDPTWYPGKAPQNQGGRPPQITDAQKQAIAETAMQLKRDLIAPTPERVRILLPRKTINKKTKASISDDSIHKIFKTMCYDEKEDDPWHYLPAGQQDCLTAGMRPGRVRSAQHVQNNVSENAAFNFVAVDPCFSLLPKDETKSEQMKIAAMGTRKWMSKKCTRKYPNLRPPRTAKTQKTNCTVVPWTPVFTRGRLKLVVLTHPGAKLNNGTQMAAFVKDTLPTVMEGMKQEWGWSTIPRALLHDKASYFVNSKQNILNQNFAAGLSAGRFTSWVDTANGDCSWLASHLGDWYPHETIIAQVRKLLMTKVTRQALRETPRQFAHRMQRVEQIMNETMDLQSLGRELHDRSAELIKRKGERLPK